MGEMLGVAKDVAAVVFNERVKQDDGAGTTWKESFIDASRFFPLLAALWAPVSTLLDIPALSQPWYFQNGTEIDDPTACIVLSAFSLAFNTIANALLVARFSSGEKIWRPATRLSVVCWIVKVIIALVNLCIFGGSRRNDPSFTYSEGFWSAVMSIIIAGLISIALVVHYFLDFDRPGTARDAAEIRVVGRTFMLSVMSLVSLFALNALIFSRVEHWTYLDGIYFSLVTAFTIGFGDFYPTYNVTRVLDFPYAVTAIALLAVQVGVIVDFIGQRAEKRKARWRATFEARYQRRAEEEEAKSEKEHDGDQPNGDPSGIIGNGGAGGEAAPIPLVEEIGKLQEMARKEETASRMFDLFTSICSLVVFWMVGAAIFTATEGWEFGSSVYFCYVFFLTIGYGSDFAPISSAGRVVFIVYALMAVPVVTSFVVQTVTGILGAFADRAMQHARDKYAPTAGAEKKFHSHAHYVKGTAQQLKSHFDLKRNSESSEDQKIELTRLVLDLAVKLESDARSMLLDSIPRGTKPHVLLRADRILHLRALERAESVGSAAEAAGAAAEEEEKQAAAAEDEEKAGAGRPYARQTSPWLSNGEPLDVLKELDGTVKEERDSEMQRAKRDEDTLGQVRRYRHTFAALLAAGSMLLELEGEDKRRFERRVKGEERVDHGGILLGGGRQGPAEEALGVDV